MEENEKEELKTEVTEAKEVKANVEEPQASEPTGSNGNGMAIASMVLGIVGLFIFGLPCGILAIIFAVLSKKKIKSGKATAGLVLGIIDVAAWALIMAFGASMFSMFS